LHDEASVEKDDGLRGLFAVDHVRQNADAINDPQTDRDRDERCYHETDQTAKSLGHFRYSIVIEK
jgi:hypothetical protein